MALEFRQRLHEPFQPLRSTWFAIVLSEAKASCISEVELEAEPFQRPQSHQR